VINDKRQSGSGRAVPAKAGNQFLVCIGLLLATHAHAADAWFGVNPPPDQLDAHRAVVNVANLAVPAARVPKGEDKNTELAGKRIQRDLASVVAFSEQSRKAGDKVWGRVTGFPAAYATARWVGEQFTAAGLQNVNVQEYEAAPQTPMWWSKQWEVRVLAAPAFGKGTRDVVLQSAVATSGSMIPGEPRGSGGGVIPAKAGTLTGELVATGTIADEMPDVDVKGKIAIQYLHPLTGAYSERTRTVQRAQELAKRGAIAVLNVIEQTGNMQVRDFGNCGVPCFNLGTADGVFLDRIIERAVNAGSPVQVKMSLDADRLTGLKGHNVFGVIPGKSDENIIVNAHLDGWYDAAGDNADGVAVLLALARHFAKPENKLERTLVFVGSGGHHSAGLNGPQNFVQMNPALVAKTVLVVNLEHIAQYHIRPDPWRVDPTEQPMNFGISNSAPFLIATAQGGMQRYGFNLNPTFIENVPGDLGGYAPLNVARVQAIHSGPMYHTSGDVVSTISVPGLERAARFYAYFVTEISRMPGSQINPAKN
jgi:hypothetical protein